MKWIIVFLIICSSLFSNVIVVASTGETFEAEIALEASRCDYYIFFDNEGKVLETMKNPHKDVQGGASSKLVAMLKKKKVSEMIASNFGDKLIKQLKSNHIKYTIRKGDISDVIQSLQK